MKAILSNDPLGNASEIENKNQNFNSVSKFDKSYTNKSLCHFIKMPHCQNTKYMKVENGMC